MWIKRGNYSYFMIIQKQRNYYDCWLLGKPFFQQYDMIFDYDNKQIGLYSKIIEDTDNDNNFFDNISFIFIIIVAFLLLVIIGLTFALIKCYKNLPRKKRANELLDDNYEYEISTHINNS